MYTRLAIELFQEAEAFVFRLSLFTCTRINVTSADRKADLAAEVAGCAGYDIPERWQEGYVFSMVAQPEHGSILAGCCSDGSLR